jgi:uncharacterized protein (TIGR02453 family)
VAGRRGTARAGGAFRGFPPEAITFYEGLAADNSKAYWEANRDIYAAAVREPMEALVGEVDERFRPLRLFRPHRDVRFSKDKSPYKLGCGAYGEREGGAGYYVHLDAEGLLAGTGMYGMAADQLARFRAAVDDPVTGEELVGLLRPLERRGFRAFAQGALKTAPRGFPKDHPRVDLLRLKGLALSRHLGTGAWLHTAKARQRVEEAWAAGDEMNAWLERNVGPSELPPEDHDRF